MRTGAVRLSVLSERERSDRRVESVHPLENMTNTDTIGWYDANAQAYARSATGYADIDQVEDFIALLQKEARVLDVGCGSGRDTAIIRGKGFSAIGLDLSAKLLEIAKTNHPEIEFVQGSMTDLPFTDGSFGGLWVHASLLHLETDAQIHDALSQFRRVLRNDGILHITLKARETDDASVRITDGDSGIARLFRFFTSQEIRELLEKEGFSIEKFERYAEADKHEGGRPGLRWIHTLAKKIPV